MKYEDMLIIKDRYGFEFAYACHMLGKQNHVYNEEY